MSSDPIKLYDNEMERNDRANFSRSDMLMSGWFAKNFGDPLLAGDALEHVKTLFRAEYNNAVQPTDMAIFIRHESEGRLQCEVCLYFSPSAAAVAHAVAAAQCDKPSIADLGLFAGSEDARRRLFPGVF